MSSLPALEPHPEGNLRFMDQADQRIAQDRLYSLGEADLLPPGRMAKKSAEMQKTPHPVWRCHPDV